MSNSGKPASGAFPFMPFPIPGLTPAMSGPAMSTGADLLKTLWGNLPGSSQVPGFLVPTLDVEELDKRIADLRAAESWVEVNLNLLRATVQGLEVQRNTIVALKAMSATPSPLARNPFAQTTADADAERPASGLAAGSWLAYMQEQFTKVAGAALSTDGVAAASRASGATASKAAKAGAGTGAKTRGSKRRVAKS